MDETRTSRRRGVDWAEREAQKHSGRKARRAERNARRVARIRAARARAADETPPVERIYCAGVWAGRWGWICLVLMLLFRVPAGGICAVLLALGCSALKALADILEASSRSQRSADDDGDASA